MSSFSIGQMNQLANAFEAAGFTTAELTRLGQSGRLTEFRGVLYGTHELRSVNHLVGLSVPCKLPFDGAKRVSPVKSGVIKLEKRGDDLYHDGKKIDLFLSAGQQGGRHIVGHELRKDLEVKGGNVSANVLDHLVEHPALWPESWKKNDQGNTIYLYFWDDIFRSSDDRFYVRYGCWDGGRVRSHFRWLGGDWRALDPSASLAS